MPVTLDDRLLWGNEAAENEEPSILSSYFVDQDAFFPFFDPGVRFSIARARKGMGKSALIRECANRLSSSSQVLVVSLKGQDLVAQRPLPHASPAEHIYDWQQRLCFAINRVLGAHVGIALRDDAMALVETAELSGYKQKNLIGALLDRLKGRLGQVEVQKTTPTDHKQLLLRSEDPHTWKVWVLVDDIDATYIPSPAAALQLSTFFSACRDLASDFRGVHVRLCVRTDVWATIRRTDEALDKCEQYMIDIEWSQLAFGRLLAERVASYLERTIGRDASQREKLIANGVVTPNPTAPREAAQLAVLRTIFDSPFPWGRGTAEPHRIVHIYAGGRPRWAAQLCRMAGREAVSVRDVKIKFGHFKQVLEAYGRYRLDDLTREHLHQCPRIGEVVTAFGTQRITYSTGQLVDFLSKTVLRGGPVDIDGAKTRDPYAVASLLFRVGFLVGRATNAKNHTYYRFEEAQDALTGPAGMALKLSWEVHPSFHASLRLQN